MQARREEANAFEQVDTRGQEIYSDPSEAERFQAEWKCEGSSDVTAGQSQETKLT
jgi:hypothetical protein